MQNLTKRSKGRIVLVFLGIVVVGVLIYCLSSCFLKIRKTEKTEKVDILKVKKLEVEKGTFKALKGEKIKTENLVAKKASIKKASIKKAIIEKAKIKKAEIQKAEIKKAKIEKCETPKPACKNECAYIGQRKCVPECLNQNQYQICGNYDADNCLEWSKRYTCPPGEICEAGYCVPKCISHYYKACFNNDLYWYNSCGEREEKYQECGSDYWTDNYRCSGDYIQREKIKRECLGNSCYTYSQWENYQNCAAENKTCQNRQCVEKCISHYTKKCYDNDVYWYNSCGEREEKYQECGPDSYIQKGAKYCVDNKVFQKVVYHYRGCSMGQCCDNSYEREELVEICDDGEICQEGACVFVGSCPPGGPGPDPP